MLSCIERLDGCGNVSVRASGTLVSCCTPLLPVCHGVCVWNACLFDAVCAASQAAPAFLVRQDTRCLKGLGVRGGGRAIG